MNVITFPTTKMPLKQTGQLKDEYFNFFSMNNQELQRFFSQDGHLVPTRTGADLSALSTTQYTARFAYNGTTNNHMANTAGTYKNITMNMLSTRSAIVAATPLANRIEFYSDENKNLYSNVNGTTFQTLTVPLTYPVNFTTDGTDLFVNINGTVSQNLMVPTTYPVHFTTNGTDLSVNINGAISDVVLTDPTIPVNFTSFDGTYLFLTIAGTPRKIQTVAP